jgi:NADPH:quinone reductase-like Zn-dependent oxidoreductase
MGRLLVRRLRLVGSTLRSRSDDFKARLLRELGSRLVPAWERREVRAMVDRTFSIEEADAAHAYLASNKTFGALVLQGF